jgi:hypothetical protein
VALRVGWIAGVASGIKFTPIKVVVIHDGAGLRIDLLVQIVC